jgi:deazaflavin-dependent oxidoreductase (nitroreductase family)
MTETMDFHDFNRKVIEEFRANNGRVAQFGGRGNLVLVTNKGAKSGVDRVNPVAYYRDGDRLVVVASKGGAPTHPDWYYNLKANPDVSVEVATDEGIESYPATAAEITGAERDDLYAKIVAVMPNFGEYQEKTSRKIPLFGLTRKN